MDLTKFEEKYESELEILREPPELIHEKHDPVKVADLKLLHCYVIDEYELRRSKRYGNYYKCFLFDLRDGRELSVWSNYYLSQEIEKFKKIPLKERRKLQINFWLTKKRINPTTGYRVAEINVNYHPRKIREYKIPMSGHTYNLEYFDGDVDYTYESSGNVYKVSFDHKLKNYYY